MKKMTIAMLTVTTMSLSAYAQTSSTSTSAAAPAGSEATSTTTLSEAKPAEAKKWSAAFVNEANTNVKEQRDYTSINVVSAGYKVTANDKITLAGQFFANSMAKPLPGQPAASSDGYSPIDPYLAWNHSFGLGLLGSDPVSLTSRYYIPVTSYFRDTPATDADAKFDQGALRFDSEIQWTISKLVAVSLYLNPRIFYSSKDEPVISAREYANLYLNVMENLQLYQSIGVLTNFSSASLSADRLQSERLSLQTGANITVNKNLAFTLYVDSTVFTRKSNEALAKDPEFVNQADRAYAAEASDYGLITSVTF